MLHTRKILGGFCLLLLPLLMSSRVDSAAVISIDLGTEWMKIGIVSPGVPMEIVLNKESKRKTPAIVAFNKDGVRSFGEDAQTIGIRFPKNAYKYVLDLLGKTYDHPIVNLFRERFPYYEIVRSEDRDAPVFVHDKNTRYTPEELVAQFLGKAKEFAEISAGVPITECVLTVPGYFNQAERRALLDAAALAGLNVLQLVNDYTAVALNYAIFRRKEINETAWHALFFDMGATSCKAALVEYKTVKVKERGLLETVPQLQVLGVGFDRTLGGLDMTLKLRDHLHKGWRAQGGGDLHSNPRAMEKLLKEAERLKVVLSANTEFYAQIEGLEDDTDFKMQVTRAEAEALWSDIPARVAGVVTRAVESAGGAGAGAKLVLAGGAGRVPLVQHALAAAAGHQPSKSINADEAATLGAVYRAAALATGFKVAPVHIRDAVLLPIQVVFSRHTDGNDKLVRRTLFGPMNPYPQKKVITFNKHTDDFDFYVNYAELDHLPSKEIEYIGSLNVTHVALSGVSDVISKNQGENIDQKGIKAHFNMDDSGILNLVNVEFVADKTVTATEEDSTLQKLGSTISKLFGSDSGDDKKEGEKAKDTKEESADKNDTVKANETAGDAKNATDADSKKPKVVTIKVPIDSKEEYLFVPPLTKDEMKASKTKIDALNLIDRKRTERETALNNLESFVIDTNLKMETEEYTDCGKPEEIEEIKKMCAEISDWLYDEGYDADTELYQKKLHELQTKTNSIFYKHWEHKERPDAIIAIRSMINNSQIFYNSAKNFTKDNPEKDIFTDVEISVLEKKIVETETWLNATIDEQNKLAKHEEVKLTIDSIREKMTALDREVKYLINKMKIWRPKKPEKIEPETTTTEEPKTESEETEVKMEDDNDEVNKDSDSTEETTTEAPEILQIGESNTDDEHSEL